MKLPTLDQIMDVATIVLYLSGTIACLSCTIAAVIAVYVMIMNVFFT